MKQRKTTKNGRLNKKSIIEKKVFFNKIVHLEVVT